MDPAVKANGGDSPELNPIRRLKCSVQNYDWGISGSVSLVAKLQAANSGAQIDPDRPYAEMWMGTHESGSSYVVGSEYEIENGGAYPSVSGRVSLKSWISENPNVLGDRVLKKWGCDLPFMFKVLSVAKALSIQAHPDKEFAKALHKSHPDLYKDENPKPEMALAITEFRALCGFIPLEELKGVLRSIPEVVELIGSEEANQVFNIQEQDEEQKTKSILRSIFTRLMSASADTTREIVSKLKKRLHLERQVRELSHKEQLVLQLEKLYPSDIGVISAFFFNYVKLNPGEALYLGANEPHAYLSGECVECMATSDNVIRAGLTSKPLDVPTLCSMLTYKQRFPDILKGFRVNPYIIRYLPPFDEFEVDLCVLPATESTVFCAVPGPSIFLVLNGGGRMTAGSSEECVAEGDVLFVPADTEIHLVSSSDLRLYRAGINSEFLQARLVEEE